VILTPTHLAIVMEYASGGELFERICNAGRFSEAEVCDIYAPFSKSLLGSLIRFFYKFLIDVSPSCYFFQARYFFQQLICGVDYCHSLVFY